MNFLLVSKIHLIYSKSIISHWILKIYPVIEKTPVKK